MDDSFVTFALAAVSLMASGTVGGLVKVWFDLYNFKLEVAKGSIKESAIIELKSEVHQLRAVVYAIARRLEIPVSHGE